MRDVEDFAEIAEVLECRGALGEGAGVPLANEVQEIEGHRAQDSLWAGLGRIGGVEHFS